MNIKIGLHQRAYKLRHGDVFCVDVKTFFKTSTLWSKDYQIVGTEKTKKTRWWQFWKPCHQYVKLQYIGDQGGVV